MKELLLVLLMAVSQAGPELFAPGNGLGDIYRIPLSALGLP